MNGKTPEAWAVDQLMAMADLFDRAKQYALTALALSVLSVVLAAVAIVLARG